ncbi:MAG: GldG family protein [Lachnospiraceae bacterium]|nr:GldG family protein [Lachnospiraceae bacterium]
MKTNLNTRKFKGGAYATAVSAVVIAIVVVVNLMFTRWNLTVDLTADGKYSLTEETVAMLETLEDDITFYYLAPSGEGIDMFDKILSQYTKYGDKVTLVQKDPVMNPRFATQYTAESVEEYSIIVVNETNGRSRYVPYSDMLVEEYGMDYTTYQYYSEVTGLDMEGQLNSAIGYVISEDLPTLYEISGHGMQELGSEAVNMLEKANIEVHYGEEALDLMTITALPEDCDVALVYTPQSDFTVEEVAVLTDFMQKGGNLIFVVSYLNAEHPNLLGLMKTYGIEMTEGIVLEDNSRYYTQAPYVLLPQTVAHEITDGIPLGKYILAQTASGLSFCEDAADTLTQRAFLTTSSTAYVKDVDFTSFYREDGDDTGTFYLGVYVEDTVTDAELAVFSGYYIFNDSYANNSTFANIDLLINSINALADVENNTTTVRTISLVEENYLMLTDAQINMVGIVTVVLLPVAVLVIGIVWVVYRRKHS